MVRLLIAGALIASLILNVFLLFGGGQEVKAPVRYGRVENGLIKKSESLWKQKEPGRTVEQQGRFVQVVHFPDKTCVSFEMAPGGVGGVPVYCFDPSDDKLVQRMDNVE